MTGAAEVLDGAGCGALALSRLAGACATTASGRLASPASAAAGPEGALAGGWRGGGGGSAAAGFRCPAAALSRTADRFTVCPAESCRKSSSEMVSRSAGRPDALAALTWPQAQAPMSNTMASSIVMLLDPVQCCDLSNDKCNDCTCVVACQDLAWQIISCHTCAKTTF